jgi:hypothetical protein
MSLILYSRTIENWPFLDGHGYISVAVSFSYQLGYIRVATASLSSAPDMMNM